MHLSSVMVTRSRHSFVRELDAYEHPQSPVRDDSALGPTEDLDREPDGVPHAAIAGTAALSFAVAVAVLAALAASALHLGVVLLVVPLAIIALYRRAERQRDRLHPSL